MRRTAVVVTVALLAVGLAACKSDSSSSGAPTPGGAGASTAGSSPSSAPTSAPASAAEIVAHAATQAKGALKSAHIKVTSELAGKPSTISGDVAYQPLKLDFTIDAGSGVKIEERLVGQTMYLKLPTGMGSKPWTAVKLSDLAKSGLDLSSSLNNSNPAGTLQLLTKSSDLKSVGTETVGGVSTTHLTGTVDIAKIYDQLPAGTRDLVTSMVKDMDVKVTTIDLWVNAQDIPVKTVESYTSKLGQGSSTVLLTHINEPVDIKAPPASQVGAMP